MSPVIEKQQFKNTTEGWIGAVQISVKGEELGVAIEPDGTVWLSEPEQILTANAPRRAEDNPFIPQSRRRVDPLTGEAEDVEVTPLVIINEGRFVPANERPIPSDLANGAAAQIAATGPEPVVLVSADPTAETREAEVLAQGDAARPNVPPPPPRRAAAAAAAASAPETASTEEPPVTPETPAPAEETAAQSPGPQAEETGAANLPTGDAPQGEFAAKEEVGTPDAPSAPQQPPAPWSPGSEG